MSLTAIKTRLAANLGGIQGVQRVFEDRPEVSPTGADMPCVVVSFQDPMLDISGFDDLYTWHFNILFLFKTFGEGAREEWDSGIEPYPERFRTALNADYNLGQSNTAMSFNNSFGAHVIAYKAGLYWGFEMSLDVLQQITDTTYAVT